MNLSGSFGFYWSGTAHNELTALSQNAMIDGRQEFPEWVAEIAWNKSGAFLVKFTRDMNFPHMLRKLSGMDFPLRAAGAANLARCLQTVRNADT